MNTLERAEQLAADGHMFFFGKSAVPGFARFATIRHGSGNTVATGKGQTCEDALVDAMAHMRAPQFDLTSEPQMPPLVKTMPGTTTRKMPGMP